MKRTCLLLSLSLIIALTFFGCDDSTTVDSRSSGQGYNGRVVGTVHGVVTTRDTNTPMADVHVAYVTEGATHEVRTDAHGLYRLDGLREGTYQISFLSPDTNYADWCVAVNVYYDSANSHPSDVDYHVVIQQPVMLFRRNAGVSGYVFAQFDNETMYAAAGATVRAMYTNGVMNADFVTTTDANGFYTFAGLPAAPMNVVVMPWTNNDVTYGAAAAPVTLPDAGGVVNAPSIVLNRAVAGVVVLRNNFANGDFGVTENLSLLFNKPVKDSTLRIELTQAGLAVPLLHMLDSTGMSLTIDPAVMLQPSVTYTLQITGRTMDFAPFSFGPTIFTTERSIELEFTNVWPPDGMTERDDVGLGDTLLFRFTKPVDTANPDNRIIVEHALNPGNILLTTELFSADNKTLSIVPLGQFLPATQYSVTLLLYSALTNNHVDFSHTFTTVNVTELPGAVEGFAADTAVHIDWSTRDVTVLWNKVAEVSAYEIFGWDDYHVTERVRVTRVDATGSFGVQTVTFVLPTQFDWIANDGLLTPFTHGISASFVIRAVNSQGEGPLSAPITVRDEVPPVLTNFIQIGGGSFNNATPNPVTRTYRFENALEYCSSDIPEWQFVEHANPGYVLPTSAATWEWDADLRNGTLTIVVPANSNAAGDYLLISHIRDNSGNLQTNPRQVTLP